MVQKTHKLGIPLRLIIPGLGRTSHKITKALTKILTCHLSTISCAHVKNYGVLLNKINNINMKSKSLVSLDIKSLHANIHVIKCIEHFENHLKKTNLTLPLPVNKIMKICTLCT